MIKPLFPLTHAQLVVRAGQWLRNTVHCHPVFTELSTSAGEIPDAIGWLSASCSVLVECKASRGDMWNERRKHHRKFPELGMGDRRYIMCEPDIVTIDHLEPGWGLLYTYPKQVRVVRHSAAVGFGGHFRAGPHPFQGSKAHELTILLSVVRRAALRWDLSDIQKPLKETT